MIHVKDTGSGISEKTLLTYLIVSIEVLKQPKTVGSGLGLAKPRNHKSSWWGY